METPSEKVKIPKYYVTWDDGNEGRIRTELPRQGREAVLCGTGLEKHGAENVKIIPCRSDECTLPLWTVGDPGWDYFAAADKTRSL